MNKTYELIHRDCLKLKSTKKSIDAKRFFKTGKGEYGEKDDFFGIDVPTSRLIAKTYKDLELSEIKKLFFSNTHEERLIGILILISQYQIAIKKEDDKIVKKLYQHYFNWRERVNNWDLVDLSAPYISGHYYFHHDSKDLKKLLKSQSLWDRRIAVLSMFYFIRQNDFGQPLSVIEMRLFDVEDLMHKACGWMLREIGKRDENVLIIFLNRFASTMPRTALRYAIEKFPEKVRKDYLQIKKRSEC